MKDPTLFLFYHEAAELVCSTCRQPVKLTSYSNVAYGSFESAEQRAAGLTHKCETRIDWVTAAAEMKKFRREHAPMTFEEECDAYNTIMKNQTYLDEL